MKGQLQLQVYDCTCL